MKAVDIDDTLLAGWPLPMPQPGDDKDRRGRALVVAGSGELPGAPLLAGEAALRAGCGKVLVATVESIAAEVGRALPEARVLALKQRPDGTPDPGGAAVFAAWSGRVAAALIGPGLDEGGDFVLQALHHFAERPVVLDAAAMPVVSALPHRQSPVLITPHAGEMAHLSGEPRAVVERDPADAALRAAARWNVMVALKGPVTHVATPGGALWRHDGRGLVGLATSGSGDVLAGLIAGLAARGAPLEQAAAWGVALHARAGAALAARVGRLGYLARELAGEVPRLMQVGSWVR